MKRQVLQEIQHLLIAPDLLFRVVQQDRTPGAILQATTNRAPIPEPVITVAIPLREHTGAQATKYGQLHQEAHRQKQPM